MENLNATNYADFWALAPEWASEMRHSPATDYRAETLRFCEVVDGQLTGRTAILSTDADSYFTYMLPVQDILKLALVQSRKPLTAAKCADPTDAAIAALETMLTTKRLTAGRPAVLKNSRPRNVTLDDPTVERARQLGDGNLSAGIRKAFDLLEVQGL